MSRDSKLKALFALSVGIFSCLRVTPSCTGTAKMEPTVNDERAKPNIGRQLEAERITSSSVRGVLGNNSWVGHLGTLNSECPHF